jgi:dUTP pyrophosphatase
MKVLIKRLTNNATIPSYKHVDVNGIPNDMGMDITCTSYEYDADRDRFIYHTGLAFKLPQGYGMLIFPRSSNTKTELYLANSVGILDSTYTGELILCYKLRDQIEAYLGKESDLGLRNLEVYNEKSPYKVGDRIGQIVIMPFPKVEFEEVEKLPETDRGSDGGINRKDNNFK